MKQIRSKHSLCRLLLLFALLNWACLSVIRLDAQSVVGQRHTLSGHVLDADSRETIIGATIYSPEAQQGTYTNAYGFFSFSPKREVRTLRISCVGYETQTIVVDPKHNKALTIKLKPSGTLEEVVVVGERRQLQASQLGAISVPVEVIKNTPTLLGENDLMKAIQLLPGVQAGSDGSAGVHVRGGGVDENLVLLDGVSLYNVDHLFGFFSVFTPEAVKKVDLYKGNFPARFGGRLSSVIDVRTNDGHLQRYKGAFSIGLLSSKVQVEGPIIKDRTSFNLSLRRTYLDLLMQPFLPKDSKGGYYFYDINAKLQHRLGDRDRLYLSFYNGRDKLYGDSEEKVTRYSYSDDPNEKPQSYVADTEVHTYMKWGNTLGALRWNHVFSPKLYSDLVASYTRYHFLFKNENTERRAGRGPQYMALNYKSGIEDLALNWQLHYFASPKMEFRFGSNYIYHIFRPESHGFTAKGDANTTIALLSDRIRERIYAHEAGLYAETKMQVTKALELNAGLRASLFAVERKTYVDLQPRLSLNYHFTPDLSASVGYSRMAQHIHLLSSASMTLPADLWVPATRAFAPMTSDQFNIGLNYHLGRGWQFAFDAYYKGMSGVLDYRDGVSFLGSSEGWEQKVVSGLGRSYGIEMMLMRQVGKTTGWLGYTLSKSERRFPTREINYGAWYPYKYDRRHKFNIVLTHKFSRRIDASASWEWYSGGVISLGYERMDAMPPNRDYDYESEVGDNSDRHTTTSYIPHRNNYRVPATHRLNVSVNFHRFHKRGAKSIWNVSFFNLYNAKTPSFIVPQDLVSEGAEPLPNRITKFTLLPFVPSVSYSYKF